MLDNRAPEYLSEFIKLHTSCRPYLLKDNENIKNSISDIPRKNENFSFTFAHFDILRPIIVQLKLEYVQW